MSNKQGRILVVVCATGIVAATAAFFLAGTGGVEATGDVGHFKLGAAAGEERAGFSGLPKLQVFANAGDPDWQAIQRILTHPDVEAEVGFFTPILVDPAIETEAERGIRDKGGYQVVVRGLSGKFLGGLLPGFTLGDMVDLMVRIRAETIIQPLKSPIYSRLLETAEPITHLKAQGDTERAERFVELLREFEGDESPAVVEAEAALAE